jgi:hypothetical protein
MTISGNPALLRKETHYIFGEIRGTWVFCNEFFSQLYSFALNKNISVKVLSNGSLERHFWGPLCVEVGLMHLFFECSFSKWRW